MTNDNRQFIPASGAGIGGSGVLINGIRFTPDALLHQSSDSRIYSAHSDEGGRDSAFVVKEYTCRRGDSVWKKAMREIEAGEMLRRCPAILPLLGYSVRAEEEAYRVFLLFERLECAADRRFSVSEAEALCRDICRALEALRRKGLVHGDVKPSNLYRRGEKWLLGDFGSVCVSGEVPTYRTDGYCSPEAYRGEACDIRSDLYSLGITLYTLLTGGRLPFCGALCAEMSEEAVYRAIEQRMEGGRFPPPEGISGNLSAILMEMCESDRRKRPRTPGGLIKKCQS